MQHSCDVSWLPDLIELQDYGGVWDTYIEAVYRVFVEAFLPPAPICLGRVVKVDPTEEDGRLRSFWHVTSEGTENLRIPDLRRCERIAWLAPVLRETTSDRVVWWKVKRKGRERVLVALSDFSYVVVLAMSGRCYLLVTAYCVENGHRREKLAKEHSAFWGH